mmetsp:Transcript_9410/g.17961  ORF Transcript_9410/g.17961 Transcript_9410/m.17961 type:complete len:530 (-) Transcript_9410:94-1683(-)
MMSIRRPLLVSTLCSAFLLVLIATTVVTSATATSSVLTPTKKRLALETMHPGLRDMEYAVRGLVVVKADQITKQLKEAKGVNKYNFDHIIYTNIGNPQSVGQQPLTWPRQVLALVELPPALGVDHPAAAQLFPADAIRRARQIQQDALGGIGTGAYSHSQGVASLRADVVHFLQQRDGDVVPDSYCDIDNIFLTNGASAGIGMILQTLLSHDKAAVMIPIPQYPLYSATISLLQGQCVGYYLDEEHGWELNVDELERAYQEAVDAGLDVTSFVLINPGNPSGSVLTRENLHAVVQFCAKHNLVLLADEVYQENVYDGEFVSSKRAAYETGLLQDNALELVSFHSTSKGVFGECGRRGGYMELLGIDPAVKDQIYKLASSTLCSSVSGQVMTSLMCRGPAPGDESYESHEAEKRAIWESLKRRSTIVSQGLNAIPGFSCQPATGSMYCFPSIQMPEGAIAAAKEAGISPDTLYALDLLEHTGICVVPASGFKQTAGRYGFRTTFLPSEKDMEEAVKKIAKHYKDFSEKYH